MNSYLIVIEKAARNYSAFCPDVPGCIATERTIEKTLAAMREALREHLSDEPAPEPRGLAWHLRHDKELRDPALVFASVEVSEVAQPAHA